jgi:cytochrome P450
MLALGTVLLLQRPDQLSTVRDDPASVGPAVEELLRYASVVQTAIPRITTTDVEIDGVRIPGGSLVLLSLPSANHDPRFIDAPDDLDIRRGVPGHLAFGHGVHHCLGAPLARMEMRIAFPALLRRFPGLELGEDLGETTFKPTSLVYGARSLSVKW